MGFGMHFAKIFEDIKWDDIKNRKTREAWMMKVYTLFMGQLID